MITVPKLSFRIALTFQASLSRFLSSRIRSNLFAMKVATPRATKDATPRATAAATPAATARATPVATVVATPRVTTLVTFGVNLAISVAIIVATLATVVATTIATTSATPGATPVATATATPVATARAIFLRPVEVPADALKTAPNRSLQSRKRSAGLSGLRRPPIKKATELAVLYFLTPLHAPLM